MSDDDIILGQFARRLIRRKARLLATFPEFQDRTLEDLEQELFVFLVSGMDLFDPVLRHSNVFVTTVIERAVARLLRNQRAKKAGTGRVFLFSALTPEEQSKLEPADHRRQVTDMQFDLAVAVAKLPLKWRQLIDLLSRDMTAKEISEALSVSKSTVDRWVTKIRQQFEDAGLRIYL